MAIVGSGPAGFYAAEQLLSAAGLRPSVHMYERLPTPWGLVRAGVAPDHPKIKSVSRVFEKTARRPGFQFHGNVDVGTDLAHDQLTAAHHAVLYAVGAPGDRRLGIPGEQLRGCHSATEFVAWYNGHPDHADAAFDLTTQRAVIVGNGNVALDVARMLALTPAELERTDVADHALDALGASAIDEIVVLGRRGPAQAAFTAPELRELGQLADADVIVDPGKALVDPHSRVALAADAAARRNLELIESYAQAAPSGMAKRIVLRFLLSPVEIVGRERVEGVRVARTQLVPGQAGLEARPTGELELIEAGLVMRSIGYRGAPIPGVPFDERSCLIENVEGRVHRDGEPLPGVYAAGWVKRGPSGVIGTNKRCAQETVDRLLADFADGALPQPVRTPAELLAGLAETVDYAGWEAIDAHERAMGEASSRPRVKLVRREDLLRRASATAAS